ncbi:MAG: helix-turn-helix transcriptional regulator [Coriobacteriales bacterium]|nr:helix-turn-helix transcriptional regulator [Coriobacteriales bacterium]
MVTRTQESLGRRIARLRLQHAMTQERLANIANVSAQAVSKWENDQSYPDILLLPLLAKTFGVTIDELLGVESIVPAPVQVIEPEPQPEPEPEPAPEPQPEPQFDTDGPAVRIRLHVIRNGHDAVNIAIPLAAARLVSNVASYIPERIIERVDLIGFALSAQNAGKGTLVDVDDGTDRVIITLE